MFTASSKVVAHLRCARGFSLIELLVVVGIVSLLIGMMMSSLSKARESARVTACASNLRQAALAMTNYEHANRGLLPRVEDPAYGTVSPSFDPSVVLNKTWVDVLVAQRFIDGQIETDGIPMLLRCPSSVGLDNDPTWAGHMPHYGMNIFLNPPATLDDSMGQRSFRGMRSKAQISESRIIFTIESAHVDNPRGWFYSGSSNWVGFRHNSDRGGNIAYLDGHVKFSQPSEKAPASTDDTAHPLAAMYFRRQMNP